MRLNTERPITCEIGTNVLVGTDPERIVREANSVLHGNTRRGVIPEKWDGHAAERIVTSSSINPHKTAGMRKNSVRYENP
jgi:UDP-N-acetylglucosamine 2-epimerase (non-hydrolysing)